MVQETFEQRWSRIRFRDTCLCWSMTILSHPVVSCSVPLRSWRMKSVAIIMNRAALTSVVGSKPANGFSPELGSFILVSPGQAGPFSFSRSVPRISVPTNHE